jgi:outer membrane protein assembly factor BamB
VRGDSFVAVLDAATGEDVWRTKRDEAATWCTPTVYAPRDGAAQVLCNGYRHIGAYGFARGEELWTLAGGGDVPVPTPVVAEGLVFLTSAHGRMRPLSAVDVSARGTLTRDPRTCRGMRWSYDNKGIYMQTPLVYGAELYACADGGVLSCFDAATGREHYRERLGSGESGFSGSAVAGDGKLYFSGENGEVHVVAPGPDFEVLAVNDMGETLMATPAISAGRLYLRTRHHVVALEQE